MIDGYIDDPAALGVPPYISPMIRAATGASKDAGASVEYLSIDMVRRGKRLPDADLSVVLAGNTVPGRYLRSMPASLKEISSLAPQLPGWKMIGGSASDSPVAKDFDFCIKQDLAAAIYDGLMGREVRDRLRGLEEWNRWMLLGAEVVKQHQDHPIPLIAEIETFRGCHRYEKGGCSYCIEPLKGPPLMREPSDILAEARCLKEHGIRNIRVGGQTCIISYGSKDRSDVPRPNPGAVSLLFNGLKDMGFEVLHVDNANPAVIAEYPEESLQVLQTIRDCCTSGNVLALGMESADEAVIVENNLNSTPEQVLKAIMAINEVGANRGENGMPRLLPGVNLIFGLDGERPITYVKNMDFLRLLLREGLLLRRINIRQVMPVRRDFSVEVDSRRFKQFKEQVRHDIDHEMLKRLVPKGTVLKNVFMEINDGAVTFGRQIGSYPLLVGVPYRLELERFYDVMVTDWGFRSISAVQYPFPINKASMSSISSLPGIGKKRAATIVRHRPFSDIDALASVLCDEKVVEGLRPILGF